MQNMGLWDGDCDDHLAGRVDCGRRDALLVGIGDEIDGLVRL